MKQQKNKKEVMKMKKNNYREFSVNGKRYFVANSNGNYNGKYMLLQFSTYYNAWICIGHYADTIKAVKNSIK